MYSIVWIYYDSMKQNSLFILIPPKLGKKKMKVNNRMRKMFTSFHYVFIFILLIQTMEHNVSIFYFPIFCLFPLIQIYRN